MPFTAAVHWVVPFTAMLEGAQLREIESTSVDAELELPPQALRQRRIEDTTKAHAS